MVSLYGWWVGVCACVCVCVCVCMHTLLTALFLSSMLQKFSTNTVQASFTPQCAAA